MSQSEKKDKTQRRDDGILMSINFGTERTGWRTGHGPRDDDSREPEE